MRKLVLSFVLSLLFSAAYITCSAAYVITEAELNALDTRLTTLAEDNRILQNQRTVLNQDLTTAKTELALLESERTQLVQSLTASQAEVERLKKSSSVTLDSLKKAEQSLNAYERGVQSRDRKIKWLQYILLAGAVYTITR
nr:MAG TPA: Peptidoglycan endopeptidase [Caudoviricetes sp.]